ncbi:MAG: D-tyrosyl-tRNA(Tyr) deacylase [Salinisphaeraceae bacterium]|jgi:D-tyrosyl-tRNA(Tyr) deacylase|nr:D-tyrosyl-tRNA(Tyr) deacylase [Salinisphaeraceae bacterium]
MIAFLQRATRAQVDINDETVGRIGPGLMVLVGVCEGDGEADADRLAERLLGYRVFADEAGRMNRSVVDTGGGLLLVPQFTLAADTRKGMRPSFARAAPPPLASALFDRLVDQCGQRLKNVQTGRFGADMQVALVNDGPVSFWLET